MNNSELRKGQIARLGSETVDVFVIGGGINGAVSAAALAGHGVRVGLAERSDFGSFTSQESSNLLWGGFKYLENYEIKLVHKLCRSRNRLLKAYPTATSQIRFLATLDRSAPFPSWLAGLGAFGYWILGHLATAPPRLFGPKKLKAMAPVVDTSTAGSGLEYGDAYLRDNDTRFVWSFIRQALDNGAAVANYLNVVSACFDEEDEIWRIELHDKVTGQSLHARARAIVNAAGPFVEGLNRSLDVTTEHRLVFSKGIHLVVPRVFDREKILAFFDDTQRLFYVLPMAHRSVIGTTDTWTDDPHEAVTDDDRTFLLDQINRRLNLKQPLTLDDIISERGGVRPLVVPIGQGDVGEKDWTALSRKHVIEVDPERSVVTILGGKLTDCLNVGEEVVAEIERLGFTLEQGARRWYGEPSDVERETFDRRARALGLDRPPEVEWGESLAEVLWRRHGVAAHDVLARIEVDPDEASPVLPETDVLRAEIPVYYEREMVVRREDLLRRRSKLSIVHRADHLASPAFTELLDGAVA